MLRSHPKLLCRVVSAAAIGLTAAFAQGSPTIDTVQLTPEGSITVKGDAFGQGPNVLLYDDFSDASYNNGNVSFNPKQGNWHRSASNGPLERGRLGSDSNSIIASQDNANISSILVFGEQDSSGIHGLKHFQEVYFAYTIKDAGEFPGHNGGLNNFSDVSSTKDAWMMFGNRGDNTTYAVSQGEPSGHDLYIPGWTGGGFTIAGNNTSMSPSYWQGSLTDNWDFGGWVTKMFHAKLNPDNPYGKSEGFFGFINKNIYHENHRDGNFMTDQSNEGVPYPYWDRIKFFAWLREANADVKRLLDDVYVATGKNANARIVLSDAQNLTDSTMLVHLLPTEWSRDSITAEEPDLDSERDYYVHVITAENARSNGVPLDGDRPSPPANLEVD